MSLFSFVLSWLAGTAFFLVPAMWLFAHPSQEADRILSLVQSRREDRRIVPMLERLRSKVVRLFRAIRERSMSHGGNRWSKRLVGAGLRGLRAEDIFFAAQLCGVLVGGTAGAVLLKGNILAMSAGAVFGFLIPGFWLTTRERARRAKLGRSLPDMVDLLVVCVGAGLGLDQALLRVGDDLKLSHPEIADELDRVCLERQAGTQRADAWQAFAERAQIPELFSFTNMLAEADRFGTPITKALSEFAEELRTRRRQRAEEAAAKTKVKIIFPLVLCIFPCIFVVLLLPALLSLVRNLGGMSF